MVILDIKLLDKPEEVADDLGASRYTIYVLDIQNRKDLAFLRKQLRRSELTFFTLTADMDGKLLSTFDAMPDPSTGQSLIQDLPTLDFYLRIRKFAMRSAISHKKCTLSSMAKVGERKLMYKEMIKHYLNLDMNPELNEDELGVLRGSLDCSFQKREFPFQVQYAIRKVCSNIRLLGIRLINEIDSPIYELSHSFLSAAAKASDKERNDFEYLGDSYLEFIGWYTSLTVN